MSDDYERLTQEGMERSKKAIRDGKSTAPAPKEGRSGASGQRTAAVVRCVADIEAKPIRWLWPGRIACGKVTLIAGDPGLGKSQITASLAGIVSTGGRWPVDGGHCQPGHVVFLSAEDDLSDTIRPRLEAVKADLSRCHVLDAILDTDETGAVRVRSFNLKSDLIRLEEVVRKIGDVRLLVIDPLTAYLGGIDSHKNADVRGVMAQLSDFAEEFGLAVVCVSHLNKSNTQDVLQRISGSGAFVAAARATFIVVKDRDNQTNRLLLPLKNNLHRDTGGLSFSVQSIHLDSGIETSRVEWGKEPVTITADEAMRQKSEEDSGALDDAKEFLMELLSKGPVPAKKAEESYSVEGFSPATIRRARKQINVRCFRGKDAWYWELSKVLNDAPCENHEHLEHLPINQPVTIEKTANFDQGAQGAQHGERLAILIHREGGKAVQDVAESANSMI